MKLNSSQLRVSEPTPEHVEYLRQHKQDIYIILENVLDTYNVGAIFRLADAINVNKVYLCGGTETPPNSRIKKASINTWQWVEWEYVSTAVEAIENLKLEVENLKVVSIELAERSIPYDEYSYPLPVALVVGHETFGVTEDVLKISDAIVELPMMGINVSLNVMVSLGIVLYEVLEKNGIKRT